jgi:pyridoxamine 5'-phosphate oxidase
LESYEALLERVKEMEKTYSNKSVPRPPHWTGCVLTPERFEFLTLKKNRLHERLTYDKKGGAWTKGFLFP